MRSGMPNCPKTARLPEFEWTAGPQFQNQHRSPLGAGLLANTLGQAMKVLNGPPPSRASPLPHGVLCVAGVCTRREYLWERACSRCIGSGDESVEWATAFASEPAPTWVLCVAGVLHPPRIPVGAGLLAKRPVAPPSSLSTHPPGTLRLATTAGSWPWRFPATDRCAAICSANWRRARADTASPPTCAHRLGAGFCRSAPVRCIL